MFTANIYKISHVYLNSTSVTKTRCISTSNIFKSNSRSINQPKRNRCSAPLKLLNQKPQQNGRWCVSPPKTGSWKSLQNQISFYNALENQLTLPWKKYRRLFHLQAKIPVEGSHILDTTKEKENTQTRQAVDPPPEPTHKSDVGHRDGKDKANKQKNSQEMTVELWQTAPKGLERVYYSTLEYIQIVQQRSSLC